MIDENYVPTTEAELQTCLADPMWRICSGFLYKILVKSPDGDESKMTKIPFRPNRAQRRLLKNMWFRNIVAKSRQLGYTTLVSILWLDHALFNSDQRCGIISYDMPSALLIFRDKVQFAYLNLPDGIREKFPLRRDASEELLFAHNNSSVRVSTSMRSGTIHRLLVSEFGRICAKNPLKAEEVVTGSLPSVPIDGCVIIESTAEGREGKFYEMTKRAQELAEKGEKLTPREYQFIFSPWHDSAEYSIAPGATVITPADHEYFATVEAEMGVNLSLRQRAWYCATRDNDFSGDQELMWQEMPSTPRELFRQSVEGAYYARQLSLARRQGRIRSIPVLEYVPINTFWDIGAREGTGVWLHQKIGPEHRFLAYLEAFNEPYATTIAQMQEWQHRHPHIVWGTHFLPHDAMHKRQRAYRVCAPLDELREAAPGWVFDVVPPIAELGHGIARTRAMFPQAYFHEAGCKAGLDHLAMYRQHWNQQMQCFVDRPRTDPPVECAADSFRQWAQGWQDVRVAAGATIRRPLGGLLV